MPKSSPIPLLSISLITKVFSRACAILKININNFQRNTDTTELAVFFSICKLCSPHYPNLQSCPAEPSPEFKPSIQFSYVDSASYLFTGKCAVFPSSFDSIISLIYFHNALPKLLFKRDNLEILFDSSFLFDICITQKHKTLGYF